MMETQLQVVYRKSSELIPDPDNPRTHSREQIDQLRASYREFGFTNPILMRPNGMIGAGHGRLEMAKAEGLTEVPTITLHGLTEQQWAAYGIADNALALNAGWDHVLLASTLQEISGAGFDMTSLGFSDAELRQHIACVSGLTDPDAVPELPDHPTSQLGDLWLLGSHRVLCGDSTNAGDVARLLGGATPLLMCTDPPYGVEYNPKWRADRGLNKNTGKLGRVQNDDRADWRSAWEHFLGNVAYVWCASMRNDEVIASLEACGFERRSHIIWAKDRFTLGRSHYHWQHEPCWYVVRGPGAWSGGRSQSTVWNINAREDSGHGHGTQKPVECMRRPMENNSRSGDAIYDPFLGSGTTVIAAEQSGRVCLGLEIEPAYVDVIVHRWESFTGGLATLAGTTRNFDEITGERRRDSNGR